MDEKKCNERVKLSALAVEAQDNMLEESLCPFCGSGHIEEKHPNVYHCDNCAEWYEYEEE